MGAPGQAIRNIHNLRCMKYEKQINEQIPVSFFFSNSIERPKVRTNE